MPKITLKQQLEQMATACDLLQEEKPHHSIELMEIKNKIRNALEDILEPEGKHYAMAIIARSTPVLNQIAEEEKAPDTLRSPTNSWPPEESGTFILPPDPDAA